jgi:hypothetical protein
MSASQPLGSLLTEIKIGCRFTPLSIILVPVPQILETKLRLKGTEKGDIFALSDCSMGENKSQSGIKKYDTDTKMSKKRRLK